MTSSSLQPWMPAWWGWHMIFWGLITVLVSIVFMVRSDMTVDHYLAILKFFASTGGTLCLFHAIAIGIKNDIL